MLSIASHVRWLKLTTKIFESHFHLTTLTSREQKPNDVEVALLGCKHEGGDALRVRRVDVSSELDQQRHHVVVTLAREDARQRRPVKVVGGVAGRGPGEQQEPRNLQNVDQLP